jgi:hypothetical protein
MFECQDNLNIGLVTHHSFINLRNATSDCKGKSKGSRQSKEDFGMINIKALEFCF